MCGGEDTATAPKNFAAGIKLAMADGAKVSLPNKALGNFNVARSWLRRAVPVGLCV